MMATPISNFKFQISNPKKAGIFWILLLTLFVCLPGSSAFANALGNYSFEEPIGNGTASNWADNSANPANTRAQQFVTSSIGITAVEGVYGLLMDALTNYSWQEVNNVKPGQMVTFSGYGWSDVGPTPSDGSGGVLVIEFKRRNPDGSTSLISKVKSSDAGLSGIINDATCAGSNPATTTFRAAPFTVSGVAPEGTDLAIFTIENTSTAWNVGATGVMVDAMNGEVNPAKLAVSASKKRVAPGDAIGINASFNNASGNTLSDVELRATIPRGFDYAAKSIRVNGNPATYREGSLIIPIGTMAPGEVFSTSFVMLVTSGVKLGTETSMEFTIVGSSALSETASLKFVIQGDPVFEQGTIIGKVFNDLNQNTVQDKGEDGVPWVRLYTEEGIGIVTDENGLYHIPGVTPGRHVVKIDGHSLPEGTKFITEEAYLVKTTAGIMNKANFAVLLPPSGIPENFKKDLQVMVTQGVDVSRPTLDVQISPDVVKLGVGVLEKEPVFTFDNNYGKFIKKWTVEVRDEMGQPVWTGYGIGQPPPEVAWSGITESGILIKPGIYSYQLKVRDAKNREDWTPLKFFEVMTKHDPKASPNYHPEIPPIGDFNLFKDGKRSIPLVAKPVVRVQGKTQPKNKIKINETPVAVDGETGMFQKEFYVEPGEYDVAISAMTPEGETTSFNKKIKVKDSTFFMVALGEEQLGANWASGDMESAESEVYRDGFRQDGRVSFFLKGKLKGKFLVKAKYDSSDRRSALFTNLNPNDYYPIYGDNSTRDYQAQETTQQLFVLVEMDRSYAQWGSFKTEFTDTELATYNRTLSGLKVNFDTVSSTVYGDPKRGFKVFYAESDHRADHNELYATGGSLFYTRNRNIIEGSEKIRVEIRDKIQDMTVASYDLQEGVDYEIIYEEGRIFLSRPLSSVAASDTLTSTDILDGSPVYLIVDYEYDPNSSEASVPNEGIRAYTWVGDHFRVGATGVTEKRVGSDYDMVGVDGMLKFGRNTKLTAEYSRTIGQQMENSFSADGGISYTDLDPLVGRHTRPQNDAYLIRGSSEPVKGLETTGYVQGVNPSFSDGYMRDQEGFEKYGVGARYKFTDNLAIRYRFDHTAVLSQLMSLDETGLAAPFQALETQTVQAVYDDGQYLAELEYQNRNLDQVPIENENPSLANQIPFKNGVTGKLGYHINERLLPYIKVQTAMGGKNDHQFGGGLRYEVMNNLFAYLEEMVGPLGDSTYFGFERQHGNGARSYANIRSLDRGIGDKTLATAIGNSFSLTEKSRMYSEREYSSYQGSDGYVDILGYEGKAGDHWDYGAKYERRSMTLTKNNNFNTGGVSLAYASGKKLRARTYWELRRNQDAPKTGQIATRNSLSYQLTEDLGFLTYFNYGDTRQYDLNNTPATFIECSTGFAYRPIKNDKLNLLARYTYLKDLGVDQQFDNSYYNGFQFDQSAHILATDIAYDVNRYFGLVEKLAFKRSTLNTSAGDTVSVNSFLTANRINFHVTRKWDLALEYRILMQSYALDTFKQGALVEIDREFYEYVRLGVGYNFTDFSDDLRDTNNFKSNGPFVRMTGKF